MKICGWVAYGKRCDCLEFGIKISVNKQEGIKRWICHSSFSLLYDFFLFVVCEDLAFRERNEPR